MFRWWRWPNWEEMGPESVEVGVIEVKQDWPGHQAAMYSKGLGEGKQGWAGQGKGRVG